MLTTGTNVAKSCVEQFDHIPYTKLRCAPYCAAALLGFLFIAAGTVVAHSQTIAALGDLPIIGCVVACLAAMVAVVAALLRIAPYMSIEAYTEHVLARRDQQALYEHHLRTRN